ncbi:MAG: hypothetical protein JW993_04120 [Sedimentisphaerales bacterium]|nr:hypothetical protein [Sedimentisphaerales bacterium]
MLPDLTTLPSDEQARATGTGDSFAADSPVKATRPVHDKKNGACHGAVLSTIPGNSPHLGAKQNRLAGIEKGGY